MPTSDPDWSILASENERLVDSRATQVPPRPAPSAPVPAPAPRLLWRRRATPGAAAKSAATPEAAEATTARAAAGFWHGSPDVGSARKFHDHGRITHIRG
jgi:hypothetical protein